jgi:cytidyltransferase-like protein
MEVAVPMCADFLHTGHLRLLETAAKHGKVTVWLMTDAAMQTYKRNPFFKYADRKDILLALKLVHAVVPIDHHPRQFPESILKYRPGVFVHGDDWKQGVQSQARENVIKALNNYGGKLVEPGYTKGISSSQIHECMT